MATRCTRGDDCHDGREFQSERERDTHGSDVGGVNFSFRPITNFGRHPSPVDSLARRLRRPIRLWRSLAPISRYRRRSLASLSLALLRPDSIFKKHGPRPLTTDPPRPTPCHRLSQRAACHARLAYLFTSPFPPHPRRVALPNQLTTC